MALPELNAKQDNVSMLNAFLGVDKGLAIAENEFSDMSNMTNDYYPVLANRAERGILKPFTNPQALIGGKYLAYVDDNKLFYDDVFIKQLEETNVERQLVMMGALLCVFPDGVIYNTEDGSTETVANKFEMEEGDTLTFEQCKLDGTKYTSSNTVVGSTAPTDKTKYWLDTSEDPVILKMYSNTTSMWTSVASTYVKVTCTDSDGNAKNIGEGFNAYDGVYFDGITIKGYNDYQFNDTTHIVFACDDDYLIIAGLINLVGTQTDLAIIERQLPDFDYVCELDNRLWACSSDNHEVYACKQGDPKNWNCFAGLDSDSYAATVGTQNIFTGIASYGGYVFFFKEDGFHKLYGTKPSNYQMVWKPCRGVQKGCSKSLAVVDEVLFYKARDAVVAYDGSVETISSKLGIEPYYDAVAVGYRNKYYISMRDKDYNWGLYVYDVTKQTWCIENIDKNAKYMTYANDGTYIITSENELLVINQEKIYKKYFPVETDLTLQYWYPFPEDGYVDPESGATFTALYAGNIIEGEYEDTVEWSATTGDLGLDNPYNKYLKRINLRLQLDTNAKLKIEIEYNSSDDWEYVAEYYATRRRSYEIPIAVRRADHVRLRLSGWGDIRIYSIAKAVEAGSGETHGTV